METCTCIVCRKVVVNWGQPNGYQPDDGCAFESNGHYGSAAFDPMDSTTIEITVCDECLTKAFDDGIIAKRVLAQRAKYEYVVYEDGK